MQSHIVNFSYDSGPVVCHIGIMCEYLICPADMGPAMIHCLRVVNNDEQLLIDLIEIGVLFAAQGCFGSALTKHLCHSVYNCNLFQRSCRIWA